MIPFLMLIKNGTLCSYRIPLHTNSNSPHTGNLVMIHIALFLNWQHNSNRHRCEHELLPPPFPRFPNSFSQRRKISTRKTKIKTIFRGHQIPHAQARGTRCEPRREAHPRRPATHMMDRREERCRQSDDPAEIICPLANLPFCFTRRRARNYLLITVLH